MGNGKSKMKTETAGSLACSEELDEIKAKIDDLDNQAQQVLESDIPIDANQLKLLKHQLENLQDKMDSLNERHSMKQRRDAQNLTTRRKELAIRLYNFLDRVEQEERKMENGEQSSGERKVEKETEVHEFPRLAATAAQPNRGPQPDAGIDAALGSAFNTGGQSNCRRVDPPNLSRQRSEESGKCHDYLEELSRELSTIETRVCDIFANGISPSGVHIDAAGKITKLKELRLRLYSNAVGLINRLDDLNTKFSMQERSQAANLRARRRALNVRAFACDTDIIAKLRELE